MDRNPFQGSVVPFARRWHSIQEIDLIRLLQEHRRRLALCGQAEAMADALPDRPVAATMTLFLQALETLVMRGEQADGVYLEAMLSNGRADLLTATLLDHVRHRHEADAAAARELVAAFAEADAFAAPETLGHMLRSFFTGCRRAVDFEQLAIIALAGQRLTPQARGLLVDALAESLAA
ncbi:hypothetical protein [Sphingomonas sp. T9W2]|uniref:hypothetical protein n=1 Tax=Sphingomonas sp. T9W2 TaxID=3143183 RepID=UPI0031F4E19C